MRIAIFASLLAVALTAVAALPATTAAVDPIQPGDRVSSSTGQCTLNFVFDGTGSKAGNTYIGIAAHCVSGLGASVSTGGASNFGTVVWMGDHGDSLGQYENGIPGTQLDFALIQVKSAFAGQVIPDVLGHPGFPKTGYTTPSQTAFGDLVQFSGYGVCTSTTAPTREDRVGSLTYDDARIWEAYGPVCPGDSGGPVFHVKTGRALGIVSHLVLSPTATADGPTVEGIVAELAAHNWPVALRVAAP